MEDQARSKQCLIGPAITKLSAGDLGAAYSIQRGSGHIPGTLMYLNKKIVKSTKTVKGILYGSIGHYYRH